MNRTKIITLTVLCLPFILNFTSKIYFNECDLTSFALLKKVQESDKIDKEDAILSLGYSFLKKEVRNGYTLRHYAKCFKTKDYNEKITYNVTNNSIGYGTYANSNYLSIKNLVKKLSCKREKDDKWDVFEHCSDGHAYLFTVSTNVEGGYYYIDIQH